MATLKRYMYIANRPENRKAFLQFQRDIFKHTLRWEGGGKLHKVSGDSGGWTVWGIAYNYNKKIFKDLIDFKDTTYEEAAAIAFCKYYLTIKADKVPDDCKLMYFDMSYNLGSHRAIKIMQRCIGVTADGLIGPITMSKMIHLREQCLYERRNSFYNYLTRKNRKFLKFIKGWLNRSKAIYNID